jgi:hypothetical protein
MLEKPQRHGVNKEAVKMASYWAQQSGYAAAAFREVAKKGRSFLGYFSNGTSNMNFRDPPGQGARQSSAGPETPPVARTFPSGENKK